MLKKGFLLLICVIIGSALAISGCNDKPTPPTPVDPVLAVSTDSLNFGPTDATMWFTISNGGQGNLTWQISQNQAWISVNQDSGVTSSTPTTIAVGANRMSLSTGTHFGQISVSSNGGSDTIDVSVDVVVPFGSAYFPFVDGDTWYFTDTTGQSIVRTVSGDTTIFARPCKRIRHNGSTVEAWSIIDSTFAVHMLTGSISIYLNPPLTIPFDLPTTAHAYSSEVFDGNVSLNFNIEGDLSFVNYVSKTVPAGTYLGVAELYYDPVGNEPDDPPYYEYYAPGIGLLDNGDLVLDSAFIDGTWYGR